MGNVLTFCEVSGDKVRSSSLSAIAFAREAAEKHGGEVILAVLGKDIAAAAKHGADFAGKVVAVDDASLEHVMAETYAPILARLAKDQGASVLCATATTVGKDILPRAAALLDAGMASDIASLEGKNQFKRAILAGNAFSKVEVDGDPIVVTVRQSSYDAANSLGSAGEVSSADAGSTSTYGAEFVRIESTKSDRPDLNDADVVVAGGRGMQNGENFKALEELADLLGAAMGASRAATDAGFVPADWQVGQTGKIVAPNLYFCVAISGAIQHLAGMKGSKTIVAINKDPEAPIFQVADYGLVDTWENSLPTLIEEIKKLKASK